MALPRLGIAKGLHSPVPLLFSAGRMAVSFFISSPHCHAATRLRLVGLFELSPNRLPANLSQAGLGPAISGLRRAWWWIRSRWDS